MMSADIVGFTGAYRDQVVSAYPLGNGYRAYLPALMRFCALDDWSPFGDGGINGYVYCAADPINCADPSGHMVLPDFAGQAERLGSEAIGAHAAADLEAEAVPSVPRIYPYIARRNVGQLRTSFDIKLNPDAMVGYSSVILSGYSVGFETVRFKKHTRTLHPGKTITTHGVIETRNSIGNNTSFEMDFIFTAKSKIAEPFEPKTFRARVKVNAQGPGGPGEHRVRVISGHAVPDAHGVAPDVGIEPHGEAVSIDPYERGSSTKLSFTITRLIPTFDGDMGTRNILKMIQLGRALRL